LCGIPASSSTAHNSTHTRASLPFQKEQNGSSVGSPGLMSSFSLRLSLSARNAASAVPGGAANRATSQSAHLVKPCRYSAPHFGQIMTASLHHVTPTPFLPPIPGCRAVANDQSKLPIFNDLLQHRGIRLRTSRASFQNRRKIDCAPVLCVFLAP